MRFWICCGYYASIGLLFFIIGRILPKKWFDYNAFPYKAFDCEKDGKIYEKIAISKWQSKAVMDASGCGIRVIASAHAGSAAEIARRRDISAIIAAGAFDRVLLLKRRGAERRLYDITEELI